MKTKYLFVLLIFLLTSVLAACGPSQAQVDATAAQVAANDAATQTALAPTVTPTSTSTPTITPSPTPTPTPTMSEVEMAVATQAILKITADFKATETQAARQTSVVFASQTQSVRNTEAALLAQQTQQAEDAFWAKLVSDEAISSVDHKPVNEMFEFKETWAQRGWYQWWPFDSGITDFVISTHVDWESAQPASLGLGGCGFVFRVKDSDNHLVIYYDNSGGVQLGQSTINGYRNVALSWKNKDLVLDFKQTSGDADFVVAVEQNKITAFINGAKAYLWKTEYKNKGDLAFTIVSGTNKDFGTSCTMSDTRYWVLGK